jgi:DNA topoisomerase I
MLFFLLPCDHNNYLANQRLELSFVAVIAFIRHLGTKALADASHIMIADIQSGGLQPTKPDHLKIRRVRRGAGFAYVKANGRPIRQRKTIRRLESLAVPPAYRDTRFATNSRAHIQAVGRDTAGRLQYRYHPDWERIRELRKARRLAKLIDLMPGIRRSITQLLKQTEIDREFAAAALVDLVACTAIRPGSETYVRERGTRGAATLLKRHIQIKDNEIALRFPGKGGKRVEKICRSKRLVKAIRRLQKLQGNRLFQYVSGDGSVRRLRRRDANAFLSEITNKQISLKDFRTLSACSQALAYLSGLDPKASQRGKRAQVKSALREVASGLVNTPAVCKRSYVHALVIDAFETGRLKKLTPSGRLNGKSNGHRLLKKILRTASAFRV